LFSAASDRLGWSDTNISPTIRRGEYFIDGGGKKRSNAYEAPQRLRKASFEARIAPARSAVSSQHSRGWDA